uniref:Uncharacterized protein n=1 Tax=Spongospora subterranea TaxID=70186 RepID=A0A0H5QV32_9EUKA|eukprot:CRZ05441.1 hypothetical protein [Spongospora subterranea]
MPTLILIPTLGIIPWFLSQISSLWFPIRVILDQFHPKSDGSCSNRYYESKPVSTIRFGHLFTVLISLQKPLPVFFLSWFWNCTTSPSSLSISSFLSPSDEAFLGALRQKSLHTISSSTDINRAFTLSSSLQLSAISDTLHRAERLGQFMDDSGMLPYHASLADFNQNLNYFLSSILIARLNTIDDIRQALTASDNTFNQFLTRSVSAFPENISLQEVTLRCSQLLFTERRDMAGAVQILEMAPGSGSKFRCAVSILRVVIDALFSIFFIHVCDVPPREKVSLAANDWVATLSLLRIVHLMVADKDVIMDIRMEPLDEFSMLLLEEIRINHLAVVVKMAVEADAFSVANSHNFALMFPDFTSASLNIDCRLTKRTSAARRDFILWCLTNRDSDQENALMTLARDLHVHDAVLQNRLVQFLSESPKHPAVVSYLIGSESSYSPAIAALFVERCHTFLVDAVSALVAASNSRSRTVNSQAKSTLNALPAGAISWLEGELGELGGQKRYRSMSAILSLASDLQQLSRYVLEYMSVDGDEANPARIESMKQIQRTVDALVDALSAINDGKNRVKLSE